MPNTFPIRNLIPGPSNQLVSHILCIRGYLVNKYVSFTRTFVCLVKQTGDSNYFQNPFSKQTIFFLKEKTRRIAAHEDWRRKTRVLTQREDVSHCRLVIKEQPLNRNQYHLPTASQVVAIVVGGEELANLNGRDIVVETISGQLRNVQDIAGYYDPLQYPLLLPYGTYGWDVNTRTNNGTNVTCRDFYAYMLQVCMIFIKLYFTRFYFFYHVISNIIRTRFVQMITRFYFEEGDYSSNMWSIIGSK